MITGKNESKISTKHKSCKCKCRFAGLKHNSNQQWANENYWCEFENHIILGILQVNGKYVANIMDDSFITCDEIILFHFEARTWHDDNI